MKKIYSLVLVLACTVLLSASAFAAVDFTAEVSFSGVGVVEFDAVLKKMSDNTAATKIAWDTAGITLGSPTVQWKTASVYAVTTATITKSVGEVFMYQDNKNATGTAAYIATSSRTEAGPKGVYSGLVKGGSGGGETGYLAMTYKVSTNTITTPDLTPAYGARYFIDKSNTDFLTGNNKDYSLVANAGGYVEDVAEGNIPNNILGSAGANKVAYIYFGAGFHDIIGGSSYGSNHITFEVVTE